jgi:hypothetical protein
VTVERDLKNTRFGCCATSRVRRSIHRSWMAISWINGSDSVFVLFALIPTEYYVRTHDETIALRSVTARLPNPHAYRTSTFYDASKTLLFVGHVIPSNFLSPDGYPDRAYELMHPRARNKSRPMRVRYDADHYGDDNTAFCKSKTTKIS